MDPLPPIDTTNRFAVSAFGDGVAILNPPAAGEPLTRADALNLAAWLVALADPLEDEFAAVLEAVENA